MKNPGPFEQISNLMKRNLQKSLIALTYRYRLIIFLLMSASGSVFAQPKANFSATPLSGCAPLVINFTDQSTGNPTTWKWDLGNGVVSSQQNPSTTYFTPGVYTIKLVVVNASGKDSLIKTNYINIFTPPQVSFTSVSPLTGCFPLRVQFTDNSTGSSPITGWEWDFGDGTTSTQKNPFKIYTSAGSYNVALKVTDNNGCATLLVKPGFVKPTDGVKADFNTSQPVNCKPPELISFTNLSTGPGTLSYNWNFGDGGTSTQQNPSHTYTTAALFNIQLIVTSNQGCIDTIIKNNALSIGAYQSNFTAKDSICLGDTLKILNTSLPDPPVSNWFFGDGTTSPAKNPVKLYNAAGTYTIKLVNNYGACVDSAIKNVIVVNKPVPNFTASPRASCIAPHTVNFTDLTPGAVNWLWDFGDGTTSTQKNPNHTYTTFGKYDVTLTIINSIGCQGTVTRTSYIQVLLPDIKFNNLPAGGCVPFTISPQSLVISSAPVVSWLWDFGDGTTSNLQFPTHTYNSTGKYTIKLFITTNNGCTDSLVLPAGVQVGTKPVPNFSASPLTACVNQAIQFTDLSTGNPNEWKWYFGDNDSSSLQNPQHTYADTAGFFPVKLVVANNKCKDSITIANYIHILPPVAFFTVNHDCANYNNVSFVDKSLQALTWLWEFGDGTTSVLQNPSHTYAALGTYTVKLTVTNGSCTHSYSTQVIINKPAPLISVDKLESCKKTNFAFNLVPGTETNITAFNWDMGDGTIITSQFFNYAYQNAGNYNVRLITTDVNNCQNTVLQPIKVYGPTAAYNFLPTLQCTNQTVNFTNTSLTDGTHPITTSFWDFGDGVTGINNNNPVTHIYTQPGLFSTRLRVTDSYGCTDSISNPTQANIIKTLIDFTATDTLSCPGGPITFQNLSIGNSLTYTWDFGDGTTSSLFNPTKTYTAPGKYKVKLIGTESLGCVDSIVKTNYITIDLPKAAFTVSDTFTICPPLQVQFTNNSTYYKSVLWKFGDGNTSTSINPKYSYSIPNVYTVTLITTSPGGCMDSVKKIITVLSNTKGVLTYSPLTGCYPQQINFKISTNNPVKYFWDFGDGQTIFTADSIQQYQYNYPGYYLPKITMQDDQGCLTPLFGTDTIKIFGAKADFGFDKTLLCDSGPVQFRDSTFTSDAVGSFTWNFGDGTANTVNRSPLHTYNTPGLYTVSLTIRTTNGCTNTMTKPALIKVVKSPQISISGNTVFCSPATVQLNGIAAPDTSSLQWKWDINNTIINQQNTGVLNFPNAGNYPVTLSVINSSGCVDTATTSITVNQTPTINAGNDTIICLGNNFTLQPTGGANYTWSPATYLSCTNCANPVSTPTNNITYYVTGTTAQACSNKDTINVRVKKPFTITASGGADICIGKTIQLNATGAENYIWLPAAGLNNPAINNPLANPSLSTLYQVIGFDSSNCFADTAYVQVNVFDYPTVDAGKDTTIMGGTSIQLNPIGSNDITSWSWSASPPGTLNCITCPKPIAKPVTNSVYTVEVKNRIGCATTDAINVIVLCADGKIYIPNTFTPNNDGRNDWFYVIGNGVQTIKLIQVFDRWGKVIFERKNIPANSKTDGWNGQLNSVDLPIGVYPYIVEVICGDGALFKLNGAVTLIR